MRTLLSLVLLAVAAPAGARAQPLDDVMSAIRNGGGWVSVPIVGGRGAAHTLPVPTMGITLTGCVRVWDGHSGRWEIHARETVADTTLVVRSAPGEGVPFSHTFGLRSQVDVDIVWSEPRDTTLFLWVGLKGQDDERDACVPKS
jgi:hypothetical protein